MMLNDVKGQKVAIFHCEVRRTTWKECVVMTWGGLRGAVGLALALSMRDLLIQQGKEYTANLMAGLESKC